MILNGASRVHRDEEGNVQPQEADDQGLQTTVTFV